MNQPHKTPERSSHIRVPIDEISCSKRRFIPQSARLLEIYQGLARNPKLYSDIRIQSAGFEDANNKEVTRCPQCGPEVTDRTIDMQPFTINSQKTSTCSCDQMITPAESTIVSTNKSLPLTTTTEVFERQASAKLEIDTSETKASVTLVEVETLKQVRKRTFNQWPKGTSTSSFQMIEAGFFACNVADRVICIYCNLICQQWILNADDPYKVHKLLRPNCPYLKTVSNNLQVASAPVINQPLTIEQRIAPRVVDHFQSSAIVHTAACHTTYIEIPRRFASFATWSQENMPPVDDLVRAGFFYTGNNTIVTCFYCNGSLQNWGANDNPTIEHARWFPHCPYIKQLCGAELYRKIQESKKAQRERMHGNSVSNGVVTSTGGSVSGSLLILDESTLSRLVAARLDLPVSKKMLDSGYKLSVIKRCWEDQLRLKRDDFVSDTDLVVACMILQKQIDHIDGKKENIIVPSVALKRMREEQETAEARERETTVPSSSTSIENEPETTTSSTESDTSDTNTDEPTMLTTEKRRSLATDEPIQKKSDDAQVANPCVLCLEEERRLACLPCGHLVTCVPCGHSLRTCPVCRRDIDAFVRIYI